MLSLSLISCVILHLQHESDWVLCLRWWDVVMPIVHLCAAILAYVSLHATMCVDATVRNELRMENGDCESVVEWMVYWIGMHFQFGLPISSVLLVGGVRITYISIGHVFHWPSYSYSVSAWQPAIHIHAPYPVALFVQKEKCWLLDGSSDHRSIHISDITFLCAFHSKYRIKRRTAHFISLTQMVTSCLCLCD